MVLIILINLIKNIIWSN